MRFSVRTTSFNSLQTGKCIQRWIVLSRQGRRHDSVSIPFKRESVFREDTKQEILNAYACFNSLQTGKCIQRPIRNEGAPPPCCSFNSLQTGKCIQSHCKERSSITGNMFQFPSNGKVYSEKAMQKSGIPFEAVFQFPSNGKVYSESEYGRHKMSDKISFNSLQTGKCIQRQQQQL